MAAADLTTIVRVEAGWRPMQDGSQEETVAVTLIGAASRRLRLLVPSVDDRITAGTLDADLVSDIVADAVIRVMKNPDGVRSYTIDDFTETRDRDLSAGLLQFLDSEIELLQPAGESSAAFTIHPARARSDCW